MPCIVCGRGVAALPLPVCQRCKDMRRIAELMERALDGLPPTEEEARALEPEAD